MTVGTYNRFLRWFVYTIVAAFSTYWFVNFLLWYPWSYNAVLGMTLMFVAITPIWIFTVFDCLIRYDGERLVYGAAYTSLIFGLVAVVLDYIFYGLIRGAIIELYHPTTLYGYAFLLLLPFISFILFRKRLKNKQKISRRDYVKFLVPGIVSFLIITSIIIFNIKLSESTFKFITLIFTSLVVFNLILLMVLGRTNYMTRVNQVIWLSLLCVVFGMLFGKYGTDMGLKWWINYLVPMLMNALLPPIVLRMKNKQIVLYLFMIFLSAPLIHVIFSFFFNWTEYMPFWEILYLDTLING
ncbi:hypothetical protein [Anaerophaga thermohalophila]|uniref:hypothetical protein n=1 Tax=Anaerophaga thermohalophila TaxID=177400 RepID=UPI000311739A|nr:hypothetical protein [Anaerophaga thermohalophila]